MTLEESSPDQTPVVKRLQAAAMSENKPYARGSTPIKDQKSAKLIKIAQSRVSDANTFKLPAQDSNLPLNLIDGRDFAASRTVTRYALEDLVGPRPALPYTDVELEERFKALKRAAWQWVTDHFSGTGPNATVVFDLLRVSQSHPQLAEYVNFLASCPQDETWEQFFNSRRVYLAFAVLGKVLEVHVFGQEMFGASDAQLKVLRSLDLEMIHQDGFIRQRARASIINGFLSTYDKALPPEFLSALADLQARVATLVSPLQEPPNPPSPFHQSLSYILLTAAQLSLDMRREPSTIYYMQPVAKETPLESNTTHVLNSDQLIRDEPFRKDHHEPIVRIAGWPIVDAYRPGSGRDDNKVGIRVRRVCMGEAYVEWGVLAPLRMRAHHRDHTVGEIAPHLKSTARMSLREDLAARRGRVNLPVGYYASGIGILLSFLAIGATGHATKLMQTDVAQRAMQSAATFGAELAAGAGTLEEVVSDAVKRMVDGGYRITTQ